MINGKDFLCWTIAGILILFVLLFLLACLSWYF